MSYDKNIDGFKRVLDTQRKLIGELGNILHDDVITVLENVVDEFDWSLSISIEQMLNEIAVYKEAE